MDKLYQYYQAINLLPLWSIDQPQVTTVEVGSQSAGEMVIFQIKTQANQIIECRYRIFGCGYLIASVVYLAQWLINKEPQQIANFRVRELIDYFAMPKHKYHVGQLIEQIITYFKQSL